MKTPSLRGRKTTSKPTKVKRGSFPQAQQLKFSKPNLEQATIQTLTTTQLENFARYYERGSGVVNKFERSAILNAITDEIGERTQLRLALE